MQNKSKDLSRTSILREWRAVIRRELAAQYVDYVQATGVVNYRAVPGNLGAEVAIRDLDEQRSEIVVLSWWTNLDAIQAFAGRDVTRARYFPDDDQYLLTRPERVQHYQSTGHG
ncbi:MAG: hypothetical protein H0X34_13405 [Chthoniobacterales bacterium]|nr:hypothetical protein [Chthoniobacterales bacterium]